MADSGLGRGAVAFKLKKRPSSFPPSNRNWGPFIGQYSNEFYVTRRRFGLVSFSFTFFLSAAFSSFGRKVWSGPSINRNLMVGLMGKEGKSVSFFSSKCGLGNKMGKF